MVYDDGACDKLLMTTELTNAEYHAHQAISKSDLDAASRSGRHFLDKKEGPPRASTAVFDFGTAFHAAVLPGEDFSQVAVRMPKLITSKATKAGKEFAKEHEGKIILNHSDSYALDQMMLSVSEHPAASGLLNGELLGKSEQSFFCKDTGDTELELKCRPDFMLDDGSLIIDIKTTTDASPNGFKKSLANFRYHVQAAWYLEVVEKATGRRPEAFIFVAVEKQRPFSTGVYVADEECIRIGMEQAREDLMNIAKWKNTGIYPGYSSQAEMISLPKWMLPREDGAMPASEPIQLY